MIWAWGWASYHGICRIGGGQAIGLSAKSEHNTGIMVLVTWFDNINPGYIPYSGGWAQWATHMTFGKSVYILESVMHWYESISVICLLTSLMQGRTDVD